MTETSWRGKLLQSLDDPAFRVVVRRHLDANTVTRKYPDEMHTHFSREMAEDHFPIIETHPEEGARQGFLDNSFAVNPLLSLHVLTYRVTIAENRN
jgi:hypothetical protein